MASSPARIRSRPGRPTMSPINRMFMRQAAPGVSAIARQGLVANGYGATLPPAIVNPGQHHAELAVHEAHGGAASVEGRGDPHGAREAARPALDEMVVAASIGAERYLLARHDHHITLEQDANGALLDARQIHDNLDAFVRLEHVERR